MADFLKIKLESGKTIVIATSIIREVAPTPDELIGQCIIQVAHGPQLMGYKCMHSINHVAEALEAFDLAGKIH